MRTRLVVWTIVVFCLQIGSASAQKLQLIGTLSHTQNSVTKVMRVHGCDLNWVSKVFEDSGINPAKARQLPAGQKVLLAGSCKAQPPQAVALRSAALLYTDSGLGLRTEVAQLRHTTAALSKDYELIAAQRDKLQEDKETLIDQLAKKTKEETARRKMAEGVNWIVVAASMTLGVSMAVVILYFIQRRNEKNSVSYLWRWELVEHGKTYVFKYAGAVETSQGSGTYIGVYKCPLCSERRLFGRDHNLRGHLSDKHPNERIVIERHPSLVNASI